MLDMKELHHVNKMFVSCGPLFIALGDEARQKLLLDISAGGKEGVNVTNLASRTKLSRPAISYHLKVLKNAGLIKPDKQGTQIFYRLNIQDSVKELAEFFSTLKEMLEVQKTWEQEDIVKHLNAKASYSADNKEIQEMQA